MYFSLFGVFSKLSIFLAFIITLMTLVHVSEIMPSQETIVPGRNGWLGEYLVEILGIYEQKAKIKLSVFISLENSETRSHGRIEELEGI